MIDGVKPEGEEAQEETYQANQKKADKSYSNHSVKIQIVYIKSLLVRIYSNLFVKLQIVYMGSLLMKNEMFRVPFC